MSVIQDIAKTQGIHLSFEFFPPKEEGGFEKFYATMQRFNIYQPDYYSITWGAGGSTVRKSMEVAAAIENRIRVNCVAHFTGLGMTRQSVDELLDELKRRGVHNILVLRGDIPHDLDREKAFHDGFQYAGELVRYIRSKPENTRDKLGVLVAGCPEGHPDAKSFGGDMNFLSDKVKCGADGIVTQFFFDNSCYYRFVNEMTKRKVTVPISVGVMLVTRSRMMRRMLELSPNCRVPNEIQDAINRFEEDDASMEAFGVDYAARQVKDLLDHGVTHFHFYTMNRFTPTQRVLDGLQLRGCGESPHE